MNDSIYREETAVLAITYTSQDYEISPLVRLNNKIVQH